MLLTITTTHPPATDLGYLLHKRPDRVQSFALTFGRAHVFYPEASPERTTAALLLDIDAVELVRGRVGSDRASPRAYVNDRPYVASSFLSVAIARVFGTALAGRCKARPELVQTPLPLQAELSVLYCRGGDSLLGDIFSPLGYEVGARRYPLDETFPEWGQSDYYTVTLRATCLLRELLNHLYVLVPVLDDEKHYWVGEDEVEKLLRHGGDWLASHPRRHLIVRRYLKYQPGLARQALGQLLEEDQPDPDEAEAARAQAEEAIEAPLSLHEQRLGSVVAVLKASGARRVLDLGCGEGRLLQVLLKDKAFDEILGVDVSPRALEAAHRRLRLDRLPPAVGNRVRLIQGSVIYRDQRLSGYDAAAVVEVIEHFDPHRLAAFERVVFEYARPRVVVVTTPNAEYNVKFVDLPAGRFRHADHRFEWTRDQFRAWALMMAGRFGYAARFLAVGPEDPVAGPPTQMAVFTRDGEK